MYIYSFEYNHGRLEEVAMAQYVSIAVEIYLDCKNYSVDIWILRKTIYADMQHCCKNRKD